MATRHQWICWGNVKDNHEQIIKQWDKNTHVVTRFQSVFIYLPCLNKETSTAGVWEILLRDRVQHALLSSLSNQLFEGSCAWASVCWDISWYGLIGRYRPSLRLHQPISHQFGRSADVASVSRKHWGSLVLYTKQKQRPGTTTTTTAITLGLLITVNQTKMIAFGSISFFGSF